MKLLKQYVSITLGCALMALAFDWFYAPNELTLGGFTGIAQVINFFVPALPVGVTVIVLNAPLFLMSLKRFGKRFLVRSFFAVAVNSIFIDLINAVYTFQPMDKLLGCIYGGVLVGVSLGWLLREEATTGGTELAARLRTFRHVDLAQIAGVIEDFYGIGVAFRSEALKNIQFTGTLDFNMPIDHILEVLTLSTNTRFNRNGEKITIHK